MKENYQQFNQDKNSSLELQEFNKKLLDTYVEGSTTYNKLKIYLENPVPVGMNNLLNYLDKNSGVITRFNKDLINKFYDFFKDSPDEFVRDSVKYLYLMEKEGLSKIEKESNLLSDEGKKARDFLLKAISGIDLEKHHNIPSFDKLIEKTTELLFNKIKERYNWTQEIQDGYHAYLKAEKHIKS